MKILELIYGFQVENQGGGISRFAIELSRALAQRNFEVHLGGLFDFGTAAERRWRLQLKEEGLDAFCAALWRASFPYYSFLEAVRTLWRWQSYYKARIIHSHSEFSDIVALILKYHPTHPIIIRTVHYGFRKEWRKKPWRRLLLTNFLYPILFDLEIGVSQAIANRLTSRLVSRILKREALCIYNAINLERFRKPINRESKRENLGIPKGVPLIGTIGRLTEQKGYSYFIDAVPIVLREEPEARFIIVGDGELRESLKARARNLGVAHRVIFTGPRPDVEEILACLDLFVSSSLWEGLPTVILESMAANVPVVATDIPGTRELIRDRYNGWLVPPGDPKALAQAILEALRDVQLRTLFANRSMSMVRSFSIELIASQYERIFLSFFRKRNPQFADLKDPV